MSEYRNQSFLGQLLKKEAAVKLALDRAGKPVTDNSAIIREVKRQEHEVSKAAGGNNITGEGVTKSGPDD